MAHLPTPDELAPRIERSRADFFKARNALLAEVRVLDPVRGPADVVDGLLAATLEYTPDYVIDRVAANLAEFGLSPHTDVDALRPLLEHATLMDREFEGLVVLREELLGRTGRDRVYPSMGREFRFDSETREFVWLDQPGVSRTVDVERVPNRRAPEPSGPARSRRRDRDR